MLRWGLLCTLASVRLLGSLILEVPFIFFLLYCGSRPYACLGPSGRFVAVELVLGCRRLFLLLLLLFRWVKAPLVDGFLALFAAGLIIWATVLL